MSVTYIRKITARRCPVHQTLLELANDELADIGYFNKDDLLAKSRMSAMSASIRWDYLADFIKEDGGCELVPLAARFWRMTPEDRIRKPEKALAGGHGKKTAGYALVSIDNSALAVKQLKRKRGMANGVGKAFRRFADELETHDDLVASQHALELLEPVEN